MNFTIKNSEISLTIRSLGAEIISLKYQGVEYIHQASKENWNRSAPYLFPNVGVIKNDCKEINEHVVKMFKHGFLRDTELQLLEKKDDEISFEYVNDKSRLLLFPINFRMVIKYRLLNAGVRVTISIENCDNCLMPFNFGLHPAFRVPLQENESFEDYEIIFPKINTYHLPTVDLQNGFIDHQKIYRTLENLERLPLSYDDYANDALILDPFTEKTVTLKSRKSGFGVRFDFDGFKTLGIWTPNHVKAPFICLEPWVGCGDSADANTNFFEKRNVIILKEDEIWQASYQITCLS